MEWNSVYIVVHRLLCPLEMLSFPWYQSSAHLATVSIIEPVDARERTRFTCIWSASEAIRHGAHINIARVQLRKEPILPEMKYARASILININIGIDGKCPATFWQHNLFLFFRQSNRYTASDISVYSRSQSGCTLCDKPNESNTITCCMRCGIHGNLSNIARTSRHTSFLSQIDSVALIMHFAARNMKLNNEHIVAAAANGHRHKNPCSSSFISCQLVRCNWPHDFAP